MSDAAAGFFVGIVVMAQYAMIVLKLLGFTGWAWVWVLSPLWGACALSVLVFLLVWLTS